MGWALGLGLAGVAGGVGWMTGLWHRGWPPERARLTGLGAELSTLDAGAITRRGPGTVWVVRFAAPVELVPHHFRQAALGAPASIGVWQAHLGAPVVFNAGQFDDSGDHLGWLKGEGVWLNERPKPAWRGLLLSGPSAAARIADLMAEPASVAGDYPHVVQSMMLIDAQGQVRVRRSRRAASRTVIAEGHDGSMLLVVTAGAVTLFDLAGWLAASPLGVVRAMNLDGGAEAQVAIATDEVTWTFAGGRGADGAGWRAEPPWRAPLPAVIAVRPRPPPAP